MTYARKPTLEIALASALCVSGCITTQKINYRDDIEPIITDKCVGCHTPPYGEGYKKTGLDMTSYKALMAGSIYGPVVIPGNSRTSPLNMLVEGRAGKLVGILQNQHKPMTDDEINVLHLWVEQGASEN
jgi:hypothetical protein